MNTMRVIVALLTTLSAVIFSAEVSEEQRAKIDALVVIALGDSREKTEGALAQIDKMSIEERAISAERLAPLLLRPIQRDSKLTFDPQLYLLLRIIGRAPKALKTEYIDKIKELTKDESEMITTYANMVLQFQAGLPNAPDK